MHSLTGAVILARSFLTEAAPEGPGVGVGEVGGGWEDLAALFTLLHPPMGRALVFCALRNIRQQSKWCLFCAGSASLSGALSLLAGGDGSLDCGPTL